MGSISSTEFDYAAQLQADTKMVSKVYEHGEKEEKNASPSRVDIKVVDKITSVPTIGDGKLITMWETFKYGATNNPDGKCLGTRVYDMAGEKPKRGDYVWESYSSVQQTAIKVGCGLASLGLQNGSNVGIFAENRAEWVITQVGIFSQGMRVVSLYATLGDKAVEYIAKHAEMSTIFVSKSNLKALLHVVPELTHQKEGSFLKHIVQFDENKLYNNTADNLEEKDIAACEAHGIKLMGFSAIIEAGSADPKPNPPVPDDWAFIMYTSGTTGTPKGAILTHKNLVATMSATDSRFTLTSTDRHMSYLPLAHIFETIVQQAVYMYGGAVGFFQGNIKMLTADQLALRPTLWCGVPRVFDKVFKTVMGGVEAGGCGPAMVFNRAYSVQADLCRHSATDRDELYDNKVFKPAVKDKLGLDQVKYIITGAAPCPPYLMEFLRILIGCPVIQGYGMTETSAAATIMSTADITTGQNGAPLPCNEIKLVDVPEMNYLHTDSPNPRGEVWIRGANIFMGYYKNPEATKSDLQDGWLKTGDVGRWNNNGTLSIIDRKKNIFKLSQGEYIAAEKCEQVYSKSACTGQIFIYGNSFKSFVVAVVVPQPTPVMEFCKSKSWWPAAVDAEETKLREDPKKYIFSPQFMTSWNKVFTDHYPELKAFVFEQINGENKNLKSFERARDIHVEYRIDAMGAGFTEENECITPTFKLRRPFLLKRYNSEIKALYTANGEAPAATEGW